MDLDTLFAFVEDYGYIALYLILSVGFIGLPVPNEVIVMTSGLVVSQSVLSPMLAYAVTFMGIVTSLTVLYTLGRFGHKPIFRRLEKHPKFASKLKKTSQIVEQYGPAALILGYFFPGIRHFVPLVAGSHNMRFGKFAAYAYPTGFAWSFILFLCGYYFGDKIEVIEQKLSIVLSIILGAALVAAVITFVRVRSRRVAKPAEKDKGGTAGEL